MNTKFWGFVGLITLLGMTACTTSPDMETVPENDTSSSANESAAAPTLPEGISLSDDGQMVVMEEFSNLDVYCMEGSGSLAISYVGEGKFDHQVVGCGPAYEGFDAARENGFADVIPVPPVIQDNALQLQDGEYTQVQCLSDHSSLDPAVGIDSEGHMTLTCS
ncbi:MAG: hypothetical protein LPK03_09055 [Pontibacter sp.]|nr:hypothetical protein [Pontibacter sp.]